LTSTMPSAEGYARENVIGKSSLEFGLWTDSSVRQRMVDELNTKGTIRDWELELKTRSGEARTVLRSAETFTIGGEKCIIAVNKDVTERKRMEADLTESRNRLFELADSLPQVVFEIDMNGLLTFVNRNAYDVFGYAKEDFETGLNALSMVAPEDRQRAVENMARKVAQEPIGSAEYTIVRKDGSLFPALIHSSAIIRNGRAEGLRGFIIDISERKAAEEALRRSEEKYRSLFEESKDVVFVSSVDGQFMDINRAGVELFRYPSKEALLRANIPKDIYLNPQDRQTYLRMINEEGFVKDFEINFKTRIGEVITVLLTSTAVRDRTGRMVALRGIIRDITSHKLLEAQLRQAQKMEAVGQLAGGIAHDFNNILTTILGYADLLKGRFTKEDKAMHYLDELLESAERASILTRSLLAFSRKQMLNIEAVDLNDVIKRVDKLLSRIIGEDIELRIDLSVEELCIKADSAQIEQVLMNLAANARDAMNNGGVLTIRTTLLDMGNQFMESCKSGPPGHYAMLTVSDTGAGMDTKTIEKIFEPFFTTKEVGKGTGLGLAMVYGIIKQHEGFIDVESRPGSGASFRILLPITNEHATKPYAGTGKEPDEERSMTGKTVLVAEDNDSVRKLARIILEKAGFSVIEASHGEEAVTLFSEQRDAVDLVVLDIIMPRKNGLQVCEEIRNIRPDIKILLTSGYTPDVLRRKGFSGEMPELLMKPVSPRELLRKTKELLDISL
jgi:two-component system cell cycle sensor histidine kinase/response regulator CckA